MAGLLQSPEGQWVLDSPVNNATAHHLHNSLFILGQAGAPISVQAELFRANPIQSFDTGFLDITTSGGARILYIASHAVPSQMGPVAHCQFSQADLFCQKPGLFSARLADGSVRSYGDANDSPASKIEQAVRSIRSGEPPACSVAEASHHTRVVCGAHESSQIHPFPKESVRVTGSLQDPSDKLSWVDGLQAGMLQCYSQEVLPSQHGCLEWASSSGSVVDLTSYQAYPGT